MFKLKARKVGICLLGVLSLVLAGCGEASPFPNMTPPFEPTETPVPVQASQLTETPPISLTILDPGGPHTLCANERTQRVAPH